MIRNHGGKLSMIKYVYKYIYIYMHIYIIINFSACLFLFCLTLPSSHDHLARTRGKSKQSFPQDNSSSFLELGTGVLNIFQH